ncbi:MAG: MFS transporter [Gammaproteobacteria bacterium]|nr:MFS transporter [Gammaproteobacteria bacterium]
MADPTISWRIKTFYGIGQAAESIKNFGFGTLLLLYYNQVLGLSGTYSGIAVFIAVAADAITDPAVGSWSDGFRHRLGRRHLFMYASAVPLAITYYFLFWPPAGLSEFELFVWFTTFAVLSRTALTFFHVPYLSLGAEMTLDYQERTQIVALRTAFGLGASLLIILIAWNFFFVKTPDNPTPQLTQQPYFLYAFVSSLMMAGMMVLSTWGTRSIIPLLQQTAADHPGFSLRQVYLDLFAALKNPSFAALFWGSLLFAVYSGIHGALNMHVLTFFWELETSGIEYVQYSSVIGGLIGLTAVSALNRVLDKKMTLVVGVVVFAVAGTVPIVFGMYGLMPEDHAVLVPILIVVAILSTFGIIQAAVSGASMMGDIADEHELHHDRRQEGVYFGSHNFAMKCTSAVGNLFAGFALDIVNFPVNSKPGEIPEGVLFDLGLVYVAIVFMVLVALKVFWPYSMSRERHAEIRAALTEKASLKEAG